MATYNYNNGNYTTVNNNYSYGYSNGNYSSQTNVVNGVAYQQNITNIGGNCGGDNTCVDGYSLYFPCIKTITRGQNTCFEFYIGDNANQYELDMRDLNALSLSLSGAFGCEYDTYTYPEDIDSLQTEEYKEILFEDFNGLPSNICELKLKYFDDESEIKPNITGKIGKFYIGSEVKLVADDTPDHIFVCWGKPHVFEFDDKCNEINSTAEYDFVSSEKEYSFTITSDTELYAIYRKRNEYKIRVSFDNRHSHFEVYYNGDRYFLSDKERDIVIVKEGYHFIAKCIPNESTIAGRDFYYVFKRWCDGYEYQNRELFADGNNPLLNNTNIMLLAECIKTSTDNEIEVNTEIEATEDIFIFQYPEENILFDGMVYVPYITNEDIIEVYNAMHVYLDDYNGLLYLDNGYLKTNLLNVEDGIKVKVKVKCDEDSVISVEVNGETLSYNVDSNVDDFSVFEFLFRKCNYSSVKISSQGSLYIDEIYVYEEIIENKGLAQLCLSSEDTAKMYSGSLYVSGAIDVDGNIYGIDKTLMGNINNLKTINVI